MEIKLHEKYLQWRYKWSSIADEKKVALIIGTFAIIAFILMYVK